MAVQRPVALPPQHRRREIVVASRVDRLGQIGLRLDPFGFLNISKTPAHHFARTRQPFLPLLAKTRRGPGGGERSRWLRTPPSGGEGLGPSLQLRLGYRPNGYSCERAEQAGIHNQA